MAFDNVPMTKPTLMTAAAALALYDAASMTNPASVADAADALAEVVRRNLSKLDKAPSAKAKTGGFSTDFRAAVARIKGAVGRYHQNALEEMATCILLEATGDRLRLTATDFDQRAEVEMDAPGIGAWTAAVPCKGLAKVIAGKGEIALAHDALNGKLEVMVGDALATLATKTDPFPNMPMPEKVKAFSIPAADLARMIAFVRPAVSTEKTRYYLNGAYLHTVFDAAKGPVIRMVTTDGHRLHLDEVAAPADVPDFQGVIIPGKTLDTLAPALGRAEAVHVEVLSVTHIRFTLPGLTLTSKVIDGSYPDYVRVIPGSNDVTYTLDGAELAAVVGRVVRVSEERSHSVSMAFADDRIDVVCKSHTQSAEETVRAERDPAGGEPFNIRFNGKYVVEACAMFGGQRIRLDMLDACSPAVMRDAGGGARLCVLMPLRQ